MRKIKTNKKSEKGISRIKTMLKKYFTLLIAGLIGLFVGLSAFYLGTYSKSKPGPPGAVVEDTLKDKMLLFVGGGSVAAYLDTLYSAAAREKDSLIPGTNNNVFSMSLYPHSMYLHLPSENALTFLVEETVMPDSLCKKLYYPICFSAMQAADSLFTKTCDINQIRDAGRIVEFPLGEENLVVYISRGTVSDKQLEYYGIGLNDMITVGQLQKLLKNNKTFSVFRTSKGSGTYQAYKEELKKGKENGINLDNIETKFYSSRTEPGHFGETPYIILGGEYYNPKETNIQIDNKKIRKFYLVNNNNDTLTHQLCFYFMAYSEPYRSETRFVVPKEILEFLDLFELSKGFIDENNCLIEKQQTIVRLPKKS